MAATGTVDDAIAEIRLLGGRVTAARRTVLDVVLDSDAHHFTAAEILIAVDGVQPRPDRATVYRTLELLTGIGLLEPLQLDGDAVVYHRTDRRHGHLVCRVCNVIVEVPVATLTGLARTVADECGFAIDTGHVVIAGRCRRCARTGTA